MSSAHVTRLLAARLRFAGGPLLAMVSWIHATLYHLDQGMLASLAQVFDCDTGVPFGCLIQSPSRK